MDEPRVDAPSAASAKERSGDRLDSWKEIAVYLRRGITTAQRWEQEEALPIKRLPHTKKGSVFALKSELDAWRAARARPGPLRPKIDAELPSSTLSQIPIARPVTRSRFGFRLVVASLGFVGLTVAVLGLTVRVHRATNSATGFEAPIIPRPFANDAGIEAAPSLSPDGRWCTTGGAMVSQTSTSNRLAGARRDR